MAKVVTVKQREALAAIRHLSRGAAGRPPSVRELGAWLGDLAPSSTLDILEALERKGLIFRTPRAPRSAVLTEAGARAIDSEGGPARFAR